MPFSGNPIAASMVQTVWAPVIAALGAALLAGLLGFGGIWWQQRRHDRNEAHADQFKAYADLLTSSSNVINRTQALRQAVEHRSGLQEGLDVALHHRKPIDIVDLYDWTAPEYNALIDSWTRIWYLGTQAAIDTADSLVSSCGNLLETVKYESGEQPAGRRLKTYFVGVRWNEEETATFQAALNRTAESRAAFVQLMRKELRQPPVQLAIERAKSAKQTESSAALAKAPGEHSRS